MDQQSKPVFIQLTDEQIEKIADRAVEKLEARIGRTVIRRTLWIVGLGVSALITAAAIALFGK